MSAALAESMRRISRLLQEGQYPAAHSQLESLVAANPLYVEGLRLLAGTKQILGDVAQAESLLQRALQIDGTWAPTLTTLAELYLTLGRSAEALPLLRRAAEGPAAHRRAAVLLARHYMATGQPAMALEIAAPWCNSGKADEELSALHVAAFAALGRQSEAVACYRRLVSMAPGNRIAGHMLAVALNAAHQPGEGERVMREALSRSPPTAAMLQTRAASLIALERFDEAERDLHECVRLEPRRAEAHSSLAQLVWMRTGSIEEAVGSLDRVLERHGHDDALWAAKAALLQGAGDVRGAYRCLAPRVARAQPPPMLLVRAGLAALEFEPATALALAEQALASQPKDPTVRKLLCAACLGVGDAARALAECESLLEAAPDDQYLIAMLTTALRLRHDPRYEPLCDYGRMVQAQTLQAPPGWADLRSFLSDLVPSLNALHNPHGHRLLFQSLREGTETTQDLSRSEDPVIRALFQAFVQPIARYRESIGHGEDPLRRRNRGPSRYNGSWSVRLRRSGYHTSHVHPRGWISSACYIALPDGMSAGRGGEGILSFGKPGMLTRPELAAELSIRPEVGQLVLFPSYFWHGTLPFHSGQPRLTVAFDVVPEPANRR